MQTYYAIIDYTYLLVCTAYCIFNLKYEAKSKEQNCGILEEILEK